MDNPCGACQLKYSSYCVGCKNAWCGMGYKSIPDYLADRSKYEEKEGVGSEC